MERAPGTLDGLFKGESSRWYLIVVNVQELIDDGL